jgi:hypothetical protein
VASDWGVKGHLGGGVVGWRMLIQALVWAVVIEVAHVPVKNSSGVSFVVGQQSVGALGADAANEPFHVAVWLGRARRDLHHGDAFGREGGIKVLGEFRVSVPDQEAEGADLTTEVHQQVAGVWVPNSSSTAVTCGLARRWLSGMIVGRGSTTALSHLPAAGGVAWTAGP